MLFDADKIPVEPARTRAPASKTREPGRTSTRHGRRSAHRQARGIGFVFAAGDPYIGIDLDHCYAPDGTLYSWAQDVLQAVRGLAYIEKSPSGTGIHVILRGDCGKARKLALGPHAGIECLPVRPLLHHDGQRPSGVFGHPPRPAQTRVDAILY